MKGFAKHATTPHTARNILILIAFPIILFHASLSPATPLRDFNESGIPVDLYKQVQTSPALFAARMQQLLRAGNLKAMGVISTELIQLQENNPETFALHAIYLASEGDITGAQATLNRVAIGKAPLYSLYVQAMIHRSQKQFQTALNEIDQAIELDQTHPFGWNIKGRILFDKGDLENAVKSFQKAIALNPYFLAGHINLGAALYSIGDYQASVRHFNTALSIDSSIENAYLGLGISLTALGEYAGAQQAYEKALKLNPGNRIALKNLGPIYLQTGRYDSAVQIGKILLAGGDAAANDLLAEASLFKQDAAAAQTYLEKTGLKTERQKYLMIFCRIFQNNHKEALSMAEQISDANPDHYGAAIAKAALRLYLDKKPDTESLSKDWGRQLNTAVAFSRACIQIHQGNPASAVADLQKSEEIVRGYLLDGIDTKKLADNLTPKEVPYLNLGVLLYLKKYYTPALAEFDKALMHNRTSVLSNYWKALTLASTGNRPQALTFYEKATVTAPRFFAALYAAGENTIAATGDLKKALIFYDRASQVKTDPGVILKIGLINERLKNNTAAEKAYQSLIKFYPDLFIGYNQLAWLLARQDSQLDKALSLAEKANQLHPGNASILDTLGWIHYKKKNFSQSAQILEKARAAGPQNPSIYYHLGVVYDAMNQKTKATIRLRNALQLPGNFEEKPKAQALLKKLQQQ